MDSDYKHVNDISDLASNVYSTVNYLWHTRHHETTEHKSEIESAELQTNNLPVHAKDLTQFLFSYAKKYPVSHFSSKCVLIKFLWLFPTLKNAKEHEKVQEGEEPFLASFLNKKNFFSLYTYSQNHPKLLSSYIHISIICMVAKYFKKVAVRNQLQPVQPRFRFMQLETLKHLIRRSVFFLKWPTKLTLAVNEDCEENRILGKVICYLFLCQNSKDQPCVTSAIDRWRAAREAMENDDRYQQLLSKINSFSEGQRSRSQQNLTANREGNEDLETLRRLVQMYVASVEGQKKTDSQVA